MKNKKICSFLLACMLLFGSIGVMESQVNKAYALPSELVGVCSWLVWGQDLQHEIPLARTRNCPQGIDFVISLINTCIRTGRRLNVWCVLGS